MLELTIYGLVGLAAMLIVAFYFAYADDFSPVREQSPFNLINDEHITGLVAMEAKQLRMHPLRGQVARSKAELENTTRSQRGAEFDAAPQENKTDASQGLVADR